MASRVLIGVIANVILGIIVLVATIIRRKLDNPKTSYIMAVINVCTEPLKILNIWPFVEPVSMQTAMKRAMKETKLSDFGSLSFVENYEIVSKLPYYQSLKFSNLGLMMANMEIQMGLCVRRLLLTDYFKRFPEILSIPTPSPVFVIGVGRSGTTYMHRLLSLDPKIRSPKLWELMAPVPGVHEKYSAGSKDAFEKDRQNRANETKGYMQQRDGLGDKTLENIHELQYDLPEECIVGMSDEIPCSFHFLYSFFSQMTEFAEATSSERIVDAFKSYRRILQLLSYQIGEDNSPRRWVLKSPIHSFFLRELVQIFPDAKFVW